MHIRNGLLESDNDLRAVISYNYPRWQDECLITAPPNSSCVGDTVSGILGNCFPRQFHLTIPVSLWRHRMIDFWLDSFSYVRVSSVKTTLWRWWVLNYFDFSIFIRSNRCVNRTKRQTVPPEPRAKRLSFEISRGFVRAATFHSSCTPPLALLYEHNFLIYSSCFSVFGHPRKIPTHFAYPQHEHRWQT